MGRTKERIRPDSERILRPTRAEGKNQKKQNGMAGNCRPDRLAKALALMLSLASAVFFWRPVGSTRAAAGCPRNPREIGSTLGCAFAIRQSPAESHHAVHRGSERGPAPPRLEHPRWNQCPRPARQIGSSTPPRVRYAPPLRGKIHYRKLCKPSAASARIFPASHSPRPSAIRGLETGLLRWCVCGYHPLEGKYSCAAAL